MLKLRKNKKGFTLVELIVVIAIMAVLAGVVAGVTVSQLNKQTDKTGVTQANTIAQFLSQCAMTGETEGEDLIVTGDPATFDEDELEKVLDKQYSSSSIKVNPTGENAPTKGYIDVVLSTDNKCIKVEYVPKVTNKGATYFVSLDGTVSTTVPTGISFSTGG